jgi:hypothetical protein
VLGVFLRGAVEWGGAFVDLIDLSTVAPKLRSLFGDASYRLDHDYLNVHNCDSPGRLYHLRAS